MSELQMLELLRPSIFVDKGSKTILFIDTYMWRRLLTDHKKEVTDLQECCDAGLVLVATTNAVAGELTRWNLKPDIDRICGDALVEIPLGRITANQVIQALICYRRDCHRVTLSWELAISEVPILMPPKKGLIKPVSELAQELNRVRATFSVGKAKLVAGLAGVERSVWRENLKVYGEVLAEQAKEANPSVTERTYERFFTTDYFIDLPAVILQCYLFAYVLNERDVKVQDVIDIYSISELAPYTTLYIMDKDQHARLRTLQRHYPTLFDRLDKTCCLASCFQDGDWRSLDAVRSFLAYAKSQSL